MKMDGCENKGVAGRAFCKWLKRKGMDSRKERRLKRVAVEKKRGRALRGERSG
jgi:hypothetical protein